MALAIKCVWCDKPLLDVEHAKKHVAEQCEKAPWRLQIKELKEELTEAVEAMREVVRISDRKHDAWDRAHAVLDRFDKKPKLSREELQELLERGAKGAEELRQSLKATFRLPGVDYVDASGPTTKKVESPNKDPDELAYWLLRSYKAWQREGWEPGPSAQETFNSVHDVLFNLGIDPYLPKHAAAREKLLARFEPLTNPPRDMGDTEEGP